MGKAGRRQQRLLDLAVQAGIDTGDPRKKEDIPSLAGPDPTDIQLVKQRLAAQRNEGSERRFLRRGSSRADLSYKDLHAALDTLVSNGGPAGEAQALVDLGANVNFSRRKSTNTWKKIIGRDQEDVRSGVLSTAVDHDNVALVQVLAAKADAHALNEALGKAMSSRNVAVMAPLLRKGADPNLFQENFLDAIRRGDLPFVLEAASGAVPVSNALAQASLPDAIQVGDLRIIRLLLWHGADSNESSGSAFLSATSLGRLDVVSAMSLSRVLPTKETLSEAMLLVELDSASSFNMVELLLAAGAEGLGPADVLVKATKKSQHDTVALLEDYGAIGPDSSLDAIESAVRLGDMQLFDMLIRPTYSSKDLSKLLSHVSRSRTTVDLEVRLRMTAAITQKGPSQAALDQGLLDSCRHFEMPLAQHLVKNGASADGCSGGSLFFAIPTESLALVQLLLLTKPRQATMLPAFKRLSSLKPRVRLDMVCAFLAAGFRGEAVDDLLRTAVCDEIDGELRYDLIAELVKGLADVNTAGGECFSVAASTADVAVITLLLKGSPTPSTLASGTLAACSIQEHQTRCIITKALVVAGARGRRLDQALINTVDASDSSQELVDLLVSRSNASVNFRKGKAICRAVNVSCLIILENLLLHNPTTDSLNHAFREAMGLADSPVRNRICELLLNAGATGSTVDESLIDLVESEPQNQHLMSILLSSGASVATASSKSVQTAIENEDMVSLLLLLQHASNAKTVETALQAALSLGLQQDRLEFAEAILASPCPRSTAVLSSMLTRTFHPGSRLDLLKLFLENNASVDADDSASVVKAIQEEDTTALSLLLEYNPSIETLRRAFKLCWNPARNPRLRLLEIVLAAQRKERDIDVDTWLIECARQRPCSIDLALLLLKYHASVHHSSNKCLLVLCKNHQPKALSSFLKAARDRNEISSVFSQASSNNNSWATPNGARCLLLLLEHGAFGPSLDIALLKAVEKYSQSREAQLILDKLVEVDARATHDNGMALQIAAKAVNLELLGKLFKTAPPDTVLAVALPHVLQHDVDENIVVEAIRMFAAQTGNLHWIGPSGGQILRAAILEWPTNTTVLHALLENGIPSDQTIETKVDDGRTQAITVLLWVIQQSAGKFSDLVIKKLLDYDKQPNFIPRVTGRSALFEGVLQRRIEMVELLLEKHQADPTIRDAYQRTPLLYASSLGLTDAMQLLIEWGAEADDGSMQEAAKACHVPALELLVAKGHDADYPSALHQSRSPLQELVGNSMEQSPGALKRTMLVLLQAGASKESHYHGKSLLFLAVDSENSERVLPALISAFMRAFVNDPFNLYRSAGLSYSALSYVEEFYNDTTTTASIVAILEGAQCKRVLYAEDETQPQPKGYCGAPNHIDQAEKDRRRHQVLMDREEDDHKKHLRRQNEVLSQDLSHRNEIAATAMTIQQQSHTLSMAQDSERARADDANKAESSRLALQRRREESVMELQHQQSLNGQQLDFTRRKGRIELEFKEKGLLQDQAALDARINAERSVQEMRRRTTKDEEAASERHHRREMKELEGRTGLQRETRRMLDTQAQVSRLAQHAQQQQIEYGDVD